MHISKGVMKVVVDPIQAQRASLLKTSLWWFSAALALFFIAMSIVLPSFSFAKAMILMLMVVFFGASFFADKPKYFNACAITVVSVMSLAAFAASTRNNGLNGFVMPLMMIAPFAAAIYISTRAAIVCCIVVIILFFGLWALDYFGQVSPPRFDELPVKFAHLVVTSVATILVTSAIVLSALSRNELTNRLLVAYNAVTEAESEAVQLRDDAEKQRVAAEEASELKTDFLANMSHELRTPLNGVLGLAQLLEVSDLDETQKRYVKSIRTSGDSLVHLINSLLDISKIEAGRMEINPVEFPPRTCSRRRHKRFRL
jgi:signal transduction histidine kinase